MRAAPAVLALALLTLAGPAVAADIGRYRFSSRADAGTFVLDTETGRVWRYDRVDDAWYLYDLEALVGRGTHAKRTKPGDEGESPPVEPPPHD
jgi:hypothetical protein